MSSESEQAERRRYRRFNAPIFVQALGPFKEMRILASKEKIGDISLGGIRVYSDDRYKPGKVLFVELFFPDRSSATLAVEVVWIQDLPPESEARFDIGLRFVNLPPTDLERINNILTDGDLPSE
jgi:Tfp pilus assembly protein PilZ